MLIDLAVLIIKTTVRTTNWETTEINERQESLAFPKSCYLIRGKRELSSALFLVATGTPNQKGKMQLQKPCLIIGWLASVLTKAFIGLFLDGIVLKSPALIPSQRGSAVKTAHRSVSYHLSTVSWFRNPPYYWFSIIPSQISFFKPLLTKSLPSSKLSSHWRSSSSVLNSISFNRKCIWT